MNQGQGGIQEHPGTLTGPAGEGSTEGLLPGTNQEYLFRGPAERGKGRGVLPLHGYEDWDWEQVPWEFQRR